MQIANLLLLTLSKVLRMTGRSLLLAPNRLNVQPVRAIDIALGPSFDQRFSYASYDCYTKSRQSVWIIRPNNMTGR